MIRWIDLMGSKGLMGIPCLYYISFSESILTMSSTLPLDLPNVVVFKYQTILHASKPQSIYVNTKQTGANIAESLKYFTLPLSRSGLYWLQFWIRLCLRESYLTCVELTKFYFSHSPGLLSFVTWGLSSNFNLRKQVSLSFIADNVFRTHQSFFLSFYKYIDLIYSSM